MRHDQAQLHSAARHPPTSRPGALPCKTQQLPDWREESRPELSDRLPPQAGRRSPTGKSARSITEHILNHPGESFDGAISPGQTIKLRECLNHIDQLEAHRTRIEQEISNLAQPHTQVLILLSTVPGFSANPMTAISLIAEIGADMSVFPTAKHLCSWAGCCPRNDQSGGKVKSTRISRADAFLKPLLVQVANALICSKAHPEFRERYRRIKARRGHKKAIIAICRMLLTAIWNILSNLEPYTPDGFLLEPAAVHLVAITKAQGLELLRLRGYVFRDDPSASVTT